MDQTNSTPDLQSILSTLARFAPPVQSAVPTVVVENTPAPNAAPHDQSGNTPLVNPQIERAEDPRLRPQSRSGVASPKPIDPATITAWQDGLRCVTKIAAQNAQFAISIRRMIDDQRKQELRWYSERQALKQKQAKRASSTAKAHSILQSLGNSSNQKEPLDAKTAVNDEAELAAFDRKIYDFQQNLEATMTADLKALGVPFFGTDRNLVVSNLEKLSEDHPPNQPRWSPKVTEKQLLELRRRMVQHLEDLYSN